MDEFTQRIFLMEVEQRCKDALIAADLLDEGLRDMNLSRIWFALRSIVIAAAAVSQLVGGNKGPKLVERAALRSVLAISSGSVLHNRAIRDASEHIDERILRTFGPGKPNHFAAYNVGPRSAFLGLALASDAFFLHFDPSTRVVSFWDMEVSIPEVLAEIRRILPLATAAK